VNNASDSLQGHRPAFPSASLEVEASLLICGPNPQAIADEVAALEQLGSYLLQRRPERRIRDIYLDTPRRSLSARALSLRLREVNDILKMTLKGGAPGSESGLKVRSELERDWEDDALTAMLAELARHGVHLKPSRPMGNMADPLEVLKAHGLTIIQERATYRRVRDVVPTHPRSGPPAAEFVIDAVSFRFPQRDIRHYEVEIELAADQDRSLLRQLVASLQGIFAGRLCPWSLPKLTLGLRLEALLRQGRLRGLIAQDGTLTPAAYRLIAAAG